MTSPTRRDEAWHAILVTATDVGLDDTFARDDVLATADDIGVNPAGRTITKALRVMVDFGYLREASKRKYRLAEPVVDAVSAQRGLSEVIER